MELYDPLTPPDPAEWLATEEAVRIELAQDHHERANIQILAVPGTPYPIACASNAARHFRRG